MIALLAHRLPWLDAAFCLRLTWALLHFVWQGFLLALLFAALRRAMARRSADLRYATGLTILLLMAACLPLNWWLAGSTAEPGAIITASAPPPSPTVEPAFSPATREGIVVMSPPAAEPFTFEETPGLWRRAGEWAAAALPRISIYATAAYAFGLVLMLTRVFVGLSIGRRLRRAATPLNDPALLELLARHASRLALRPAPAIGWCSRAAVPVVIGIVRPMILLPSSLTTGLTTEQLEYVLIHELAHIRRYDLLANLLERLIEVVLFFHPAVWWLTRQVSLERESACDDAVLQAGCAGPAYAEALLRVAELCALVSPPLAPTGSLAAAGRSHSQLRRRLMRLFEAEVPPPVRPGTPAVAIVALIALSAVIALTAWRSPATAQVADGVPAARAEGPPREPVTAADSGTTAADITVEEENAKAPVGLPVTFSGAEIIALVGPEVIFAGDVLPDANSMIHRMQGRTAEPPPAGDLERLRKVYMSKFLDQVIRTKLLIVEGKRKLPQDAWGKIEKQFNETFDKDYLPKMFESEHCRSPAELDAILRQGGSSLEALRRRTLEQSFADHWLEEKTRDDSQTTPEDAEQTNAKRQAYTDQLRQTIPVWNIFAEAVDVTAPASDGEKPQASTGDESADAHPGEAQSGKFMAGPLDFLSPATSIDASLQGQNVVDIRVVGNETCPTEQILSAIRTRVGQPFDAATLNHDVRALAAKKWFFDVLPKCEQVDGGVRVTIAVPGRRPALLFRKHGGNAANKENRVLEEIGLDRKSLSDPAAIGENRRKLLFYYRSIGFPDATVTVIAGDKSADRGVIYVIDEGQRHKPEPRAEQRPAADSSAAELRAAVVDNYDSITSIDCRYTVEFLFADQRKEASSKECRYLRSANKWRYAELTAQDVSHERALGEMTRSCDDRFEYSFFLEHLTEGDSARSVQIHDRQANPGGFNPENLIGRNLSNVARSLPDVLALNGVTKSLAASQGKPRWPCLSIAGVSGGRPNSPQKYDISVAVDAAHDFLPREILIRESADTISVLGWAQNWRITEYQQVFDESTGQPRWFPTVGLMSQGETGAPVIKLVVTSARINPTLEAAVFTPDFPAGVPFLDATSDGSGAEAIEGGHLIGKAKRPAE